MKYRTFIAILFIFVGISLGNEALATRAEPAVPPVVTITAPSFLTENYGDWSVNRLDAGYLALANNESNSTFGVLCLTKCINVFNFNVQCDNNNIIPALVNSSSGAYHINLSCYRVDEKTYFLSTPFDQSLYNAMEIGGVLGISFPLKSGEFKVARFSLTGALKASVRAFELSPANNGKSGDQGLHDQTL